jgi:predicted nucleic acid-binding protein
VIHLDTSALVDALTGTRRSARTLRAAIDAGERVHMSTIVLYEWLRGPRRTAELDDQETLFPGAAAIPFDKEAAAIAARLYAKLPRARGREIDLAIAACAIAHGAALWTLNRADFADIPDLRLHVQA